MSYTLNGGIVNNNINFEKNEIVFNYRVACIIKKNNKILVQSNSKANYLSLPGGRCEFGENSINAIKREIMEEMGYETSLVKEIGIIENFFTSSFNKKRYHEILFLYELKFNNKEVYNMDTISTIEENKKECVKYNWIEIENLKPETFKPYVAIKIINSDNFTHIINDK